MKSIGMQRLLVLVALFTGLGMFTISCEKDPCEDVTCQNGGTATEINDGEDCECDCAEGYEGEFCETEWREDFLATYDVTDQCNSGTYQYESTVSSVSGSVTELSIGNAGGFNNSISATITDSVSIEIPFQEDASGRDWEGTGTYDPSTETLTISYTVTFDDGSEDECTGTYSN